MKENLHSSSSFPNPSLFSTQSSKVCFNHPTKASWET